MGERKQQAITDPQVGMVILEDDPRQNLARRIISLDERYAYCRSGRYGTGRRSRVSRKRLAEGRYKLMWGDKDDE